MLREMFSLSPQGVHDLKQGILWSAAANISLMLPVGLILMIIAELLKPLFGEPVSIPNVWLYTGLAAVILVLIYGVHLRQYTATYIAAYEESANRRITLAEKLRQLPLSYFGRKNLSELTTTMMGDCTALEHTFSHAIPQAFGAVIAILLVCIGLFCMEWRMALALFLALPLSLLLVLGSKRIQDRFSRDKITDKLIAADGIQECLETVKDIRSCGREEKYLADLDTKFDAMVSSAIRSECITGSFVSSGMAVLRLGFATVIFIGGGLIVTGEINFLTYLIFLLVASRIYDPLSTMFMQIAEIFESRVRIDRMQTLEQQPVQTGSSECLPAGYDIVFDHVTFSYNRDTVLSDVSFTAKQGEVTALVGPSGSGKSTVAKLAARFWDVNSGTITLGGVDISTVEPEVLLRQYSVVFQDVVLFHTTILENIRIGRKDATTEEVYAAARAARCEEFISRLPEGYQTVVGENGDTLSGGERQRLSIARALLKDAPVILLDEATASLDVENETLIQSALSTLTRNKTVLVIAHRMRTVASADTIVVLDNGKVAETGTGPDLLQKNGLYARMTHLQQQSVSWQI